MTAVAVRDSRCGLCCGRGCGALEAGLSWGALESLPKKAVWGYFGLGLGFWWPWLLFVSGFVFFEIGSFCVYLAGLELTQICLCLPSTGLKARTTTREALY